MSLTRRAGVLYSREVRCGYIALSNKHNRLGAGNFKPAPATHILTGQHIVNPDHVVARPLKPNAILLVSAARWARLFRAPQPAYFVFHTFAAVRTTKCRLFQLLFFIEEVLFVHLLDCFGSGPSPSPLLPLSQFSQITKAVNAGLVPIAPAKV